MLKYINLISPANFANYSELQRRGSQPMKKMVIRGDGNKFQVGLDSLQPWNFLTDSTAAFYKS